MKKLSTYLFLVLFSFSTPSFAYHNGYFHSQDEIEGMSVGDNLLDHFSEKEIEKFEKIPTRHWFDGITLNSPHYKKGEINFLAYYFDRLTVGITISSPNFKIYDEIDVLVYLRGEIYEIWGLTGKIFYQNDINECHKKMNKIVREFSKTFSNLKKYKKLTEYGMTTVQFGGEVQSDWHTSIKNGASVSCLDFPVGSGLIDHLSVSIYLSMGTM